MLLRRINNVSEEEGKAAQFGIASSHEGNSQYRKHFVKQINYTCVCLCVNASGRHTAYIRRAQFFFFFYPVSESQQERGSSHPQTTNSESHPGASCVTIRATRPRRPYSATARTSLTTATTDVFCVELKCKQLEMRSQEPSSQLGQAVELLNK